MKILSNTAYDHFTDSAVDHIFTFSPDTSATMGKTRVRKSVDYCMIKAARLGFTSKGSVLFLLECMYSFGSEFDTDPTLSWASETLTDPTIELPETRIALVYDRMNAFTSEVFGERYSNFLGALKKLAELIKAPIRFDAATFESTMLSLLYRVFPRRCVLCGDQVLRSLIRKGVRDMARLGIESWRAKAIAVFLMLFLGHGVLGDPIYFWIGDTLKINGTAKESPDRAQVLEKKVGLFLDNTIARLEGTHVLVR